MDFLLASCHCASAVEARRPCESVRLMSVRWIRSLGVATCQVRLALLLLAPSVYSTVCAWQGSSPSSWMTSVSATKPKMQQYLEPWMGSYRAISGRIVFPMTATDVTIPTSWEHVPYATEATSNPPPCQQSWTRPLPPRLDPRPGRVMSRTQLTSTRNSVYQIRLVHQR